MAASKYDFSIEQGTSFRLSIVHRDDSGDPINMTGYCARVIWKTSSGETMTFNSENTNNSQYKFTIDPLNGKITLLIPASVTNNYAFTNAKYDLEIQTPQDLYLGGGKNVERVLYGTVTILKRFSQSTEQLSCST
jgi:hypothetical protein